MSGNTAKRWLPTSVVSSVGNHCLSTAAESTIRINGTSAEDGVGRSTTVGNITHPDTTTQRCGSDPNFDKEESIVEIDSEVNMLDSHVILNLPLSPKTVADYTRKDPILAKVLHFVINGWPTTWPHNQDNNKVRRCGVRLRYWRVVITTAYRARVLNELHLTHMGIAA